MGKIDIDKQTDHTKKEVAQPATQKQAVNANANEAKSDAKKSESDKKVVVTYIGSGIWQDSDGKYWAREPKGATIENERQYTEEEYNNHEDIKFMVGYGEMKATFVE